MKCSKSFIVTVAALTNIGRRQWLFHDRRTNHGPVLAEFLKHGWKRNTKTINTPKATSSIPDPLPNAPIALHVASSN